MMLLFVMGMVYNLRYHLCRPTNGLAGGHDTPFVSRAFSTGAPEIQGDKEDPVGSSPPVNV
jgi:hypothetical protein